MKNILYILCILLIAVPAAFADADIDAVKMNWQNGEVVVMIDASSHFQFTHQIEEAKDGRPYRVIVDIFPAVHKLGQKSFFDLPKSIVKAIRTSQYAVKPNKTVRVVLDLNSESVYRIEKKGNTVFIYIPDSKGSEFPAWVSKDYIKPSTPVVKPKTEKSPVVAKADKPAPVVEVKESPQVSSKPETTFYKPERSGLVEKDWAQPIPEKPNFVSTIESAKVDEKPAVEKTKPVKAETVDKSKSADATKEKADRTTESVKPVQKESKKSDKKVTPKNEFVTAPAPESKTAPVVKPEKQKNNQVESKPAVTPPVEENPAQLVVEEKSEPTEKESAQKPTSRFRRQPAFPAKLKGTIVAEFPKRMVIKYKPGISRDPFASLIDETKKSDSPLEKKIPDVETARLVGILESSDGQNRALLEDLDGYGFILKSGDKVKKGYVSQIYSNKALFQIFEYGWSRSVALHLDDNE